MDLHRLEALALGEDRDAAIAALVPGTDEHDFWLSIRHQHLGELDAVDELLGRWRKRPGHHNGIDVIERRQLLLRADSDLPGQAEALRSHLELSLEHQPEVEQEAARYPTHLDPNQISAEAVIAATFRKDRGLGAVNDAALPWVLANRKLDATRRRQLLSRLPRGGQPELIEAIALDLEDGTSKGFPSLPIHYQLTLAELAELAARRPQLALEPGFVYQRIMRERPPSHVDLERSMPERIAYLDRLWGLCHALPPVFASLKAHVLYHRLDCDRRTGISDRGRLLTYLALPRSVSYLRGGMLDGLDRSQIASLDERLTQWTGLPSVDDDEPLVKSLLMALLEREGPEPFAQLLDRRWLDRLWAETRLLCGDLDTQRWAALLGPAAVEQLRDRVDIELLPTNPSVVGRDEPVVLDVALKNAWPLRIRVFRIDMLAYVSACGAEVPLDLDLDGLAAGVEEVRTAEHHSMRRVRERIPIPQAQDPGTYIIELHGGGRASRALVRKGDLRCLTRPCAAGLDITVLDERGAAVPSAKIRMNGRDYGIRDGLITLPFSTRGESAKLLLCDDALAVPLSLSLPLETPSLAVAVLLDRQSLVPEHDAVAVVRVDLLLSSHRAPISLLEEPYVEVVTSDRAGISRRKRSPLSLRDHNEGTCVIAVPEHLASLSIAVGGRYRSISQQQLVDLRQEQSIDVGTIHNQPLTEAFYLERSSAGFVLRLLGKSGEPRGGRAVHLALLHRFCDDLVEIVLSTDAQGRVSLGELPDIVEIRAWVASRDAQRFDLRPHTPVVSPMIRTREGEEIVVPTLVGPDGRAPADVRLVELRASVPALDLSASVRKAPGLLRISGLVPGDYLLECEGIKTTITVLDASVPVVAAIASTATALVELYQAPTVIAGLTLTEGGLSIQVEHSRETTRVCVLGALMWPSPAWSSDLSTVRPRTPSLVSVRPVETRYLSGRDIGDEYRYVLDRSRLARRPGTMLERPGLLLNPWALRSVETFVQFAYSGAGWGGAAAPAPPPSAAGPDGAREKRFAQSFADVSLANYDFLADLPVILANLEPDEHGHIHVPREDLGSAGLVWVVCLDPTAVTVRSLPLPPRTLAATDRALAQSLPVDRHLREDRRICPMPSGQSLTVSERATTRLEWVDTVDVLYRALCTLGGDPSLIAWTFLPKWGSLPREEKLRLYSEHACHELSLFIYLKDRLLFDEVVLPYLRNKLHLTFIDQFLIGEDLTAWLAPWKLARLNAFERALLATRIPQAKSALAQQLSDAVDLVPPDPAADDRLVELFLASAERRALLADEAPSDALKRMPSEDKPAKQEEAKPDTSLRRKSKDARGEDDNYGEIERELGAREQTAQLYRGIDKTREWAEHNWWHRRLDEQGPEMIAPARLWRDLARHDGGPFLSPHLVDGAACFAASVCALAVIDLPFEAQPHEIVADGASAVLRAGSHALAALSLLAPVAGPPAGEVLVGQSVLRADDRYEWDGALQREKIVTGELVTGVIYEGRVVVTNPTSRTLHLAVLVQIPAGAIPVSGGIPTRTHRLTLEPYNTSTIDYGFYLPREGTFSWYGARVVSGEVLLAAGADRIIEVVCVPTTVDADSWPHVSQRAQLPELLAFLRSRNLARIDLSQIAWRMREREPFERITAELSARYIYDDVLWSYSLLHHDRVRYAQWLMHQEDLLSVVGPLSLSTGRVDPIERGTAQHLEYAPIVNARAHQLGAWQVVPNEGLAAQWTRWLDRIARTESPTAAEKLAAAHYLFTMDRPEEAVRALQRVSRGEVSCTLQYDYLAAYAASVMGDLAGARAHAQPHVQHPVDRWRHRFAALVSMLDEALSQGGPYTADPTRREARMDDLAMQQPALAARAEGPSLLLDHARLTTATVRLYRMDVELLFSRQPFLSADVERFTFIEPSALIEVPLADKGQTLVPLPEALKRSDVVIEVRSGPLRSVLTRYASDLVVSVTAPYGQLQVRRASTGAMLPASYVKTFARMRDGTVQFYKDGYTDLRGRFDYATLSTDDLDRVERFALLVSHDDAGAMVLEAEPPIR